MEVTLNKFELLIRPILDIFVIPSGKRLFTGIVPVNKKHLTGTVPVNKKHLTGTVPVNKKHLTGTVPVNKKHLTGTVPVTKKHLTGTVPLNNKRLTDTLFIHYIDVFASSVPVPVIYQYCTCILPALLVGLSVGGRYAK